MKRIVSLALVGLCLLVCSCGPTTQVVVTDRAGAPVAGAKVRALSFALNKDRPKITDGKGRVSVPWTTEKVRWLNVSAQGFKRSVAIFKGEKEQTVVLNRPGEGGASPDPAGEPPPPDVPLEEPALPAN